MNDYYKEEYTHYIFVADDYLLNPRINAENFLEWFGLSSQEQDACFHPMPFHNIGKIDGSLKIISWAYNYSPQIPGFSTQKELPSFKEALSRFKELGLDTTFFKEYGSDALTSFYYDKGDYYYPYATYHKALQHINHPTGGRKILGMCYSTYLHPLWMFRKIRNKFKPYTMSYPLVFNSGDIIVIPAKQIKKFAKYCAIFGAANLFVEFAIPTAMILLGCPLVHGNPRSLSSFKESSEHNELKMLLMDNGQTQSNLDVYDKCFNDLLADYHSTNILGSHPIKLSQ